jgi:hypothetical protein
MLVKATIPLTLLSSGRGVLLRRVLLLNNMAHKKPENKNRKRKQPIPYVRVHAARKRLLLNKQAETEAQSYLRDFGG